MKTKRTVELTKLVSLGFEENVGAADRVLRLLSGAGGVVAAWYVEMPLWARVAATVLGLMWTATGILSKCSIYYALGWSTCPARVPPVAE